MSEQDDQLLKISGLANSYVNDGSGLSADETVRAILDTFPEAMSEVRWLEKYRGTRGILGRVVLWCDVLWLKNVMRRIRAI